jgi:hypothetical protein
MKPRSVRERLNSIIIRLERAKKLSVRQRRLGKNELQDWVDRELKECSREELDELPGREFMYLFSKISELLLENGIVVALMFAGSFSMRG